MAATTQLNARLDCDLKASGDEALLLIGLSPTQAVRALWEKAAKRGNDLEQVAALLSPEARKPEQSGQSRADEVVRSGWAFMDEAYKSLGINPDAVSDLPNDKEMLENALYEKLVERGLA